MKKIRIIGRSPKQLNKSEDKDAYSPRQKKFSIKQYKLKTRFQDRKQTDDNSKLSYRETNYSHRYKPQLQSLTETPFDLYEYSPREGIKRSQTNKLSQEYHKTIYKPRQLRLVARRSTEKSPYLDRNILNKSERNIIITSRNYVELGRKDNKILEPMRYNSLEAKSNSLRLKRDGASDANLNQAHKLMLNGDARKSLFILKGILAKDPHNLQALHIAATNLYNIGDYIKSLQHLNTILNIKKDYSFEVHLLKAKATLKVNNNLHDFILALSQCSSSYPSAKLHILIEQGQAYMSLHQYEEALKYFQAAYRLNDHHLLIIQTLIAAYDSLQQYPKVIQSINNLNQISPVDAKKYNNIKCRCYFEMGQSDKILNEFDQSDDPALYYYLGWAYYKNNQMLKAYLALESSLVKEGDCTKSIKLMILILCKEHDFYQAYHLIERCEHLIIKRQTLIKQFGFIDGILLLMKKNIAEGIQKINQVLNEIESNDDQFATWASTQVHAFLAYGYFILGNFEECQNQYKLQILLNQDVAIQGMQYNKLINKAYMQYKIGNLQQSLILFQNAVLVYPKRVQPIFCIAIIYVNLAWEEKVKKGQKVQLLQKSKNYLNEASKFTDKTNSNMRANILYHKSVLHAFLEEWRDAMASIDLAIQKSQENYWRFFYVKALILACVHNFDDAIKECSVVINIKDIQPYPYLLRACCFQIEGESGLAFKDLQTYITLRPEDRDVSILAGKFLFENGAFEDAISAFNHKAIPQLKQYYDAFMTKSKTYFLMGRFIQASEQMQKAYKVDLQKVEAKFDSKMMLILHKMLNLNVSCKQIIKQIDIIYDQNSAPAKTQIFKLTQKYTLKSACYFYLSEYDQAIKQLQSSIQIKQKLIIKQSLIEGGARQDEKDARLFTCQMQFNIALCYLMLNQLQKAEEIALNMPIFSADLFYTEYKRFLLIFKQPIPTIPGKQKQIVQIQVFPSRNKISNYLKGITVDLKGKTICSKLCIPFPKVEPPQIFPVFDVQLLKQFTINRVEKKPEAPWICRQQNAIVFTNKIQKYSRLQIEQSSSEFSKDKDEIEDSNQIQSNSLSQLSVNFKKKANSYKNNRDQEF